MMPNVCAPQHTVSPPSSSGVGKSLFVKGLSKGASERCLISLFSQYGRVVDCQIARHRSGRSAGFAIISFSRHEEAMAAMCNMDNATFMGRRVNIRWYQPEREQPNMHQTQPSLGTLDLQGLSSAGLGNIQFLGQLSSADSASLAVLAAAVAQSSGDQPLPLMPEWISQLQGTSQPQAADDMQSEGVRRWSAMVNVWLQDYLNQEQAQPIASTAAPSLARRSFDGSSPAVPSRRRTTQGSSLSLSLDGLDLSGLQEATAALQLTAASTTSHPLDSFSFDKSRLLTKWGATSQKEQQAGTPTTACSEPSCSSFCLLDRLSSSPSEAGSLSTTGSGSAGPASSGSGSGSAALLQAQISLPSVPSAGGASSSSSSSSSSPRLHRADSWETLDDDARRISLDQIVDDQPPQRTVPSRKTIVPPKQAAAAAASVQLGLDPAGSKGMEAQPALEELLLSVAAAGPAAATPFSCLAGLPGLDLSAVLMQQLQAQAAVKQAQQLTVAQQQYATALAQLANAQHKVLTAAAMLRTVDPVLAAAAAAPASLGLVGASPAGLGMLQAAHQAPPQGPAARFQVPAAAAGNQVQVLY